MRSTSVKTLEKERNGKSYNRDHSLLQFPNRRTNERRKCDRRVNAITKLKKITVVIPALNEEQGIGLVVDEIPIVELMKMGYGVEVMVIDNGSKDKTRIIANSHGAKVIVQPIRGYGNAYKAGFSNADGEIIATGDADMTYPFSVLPEIIKKMEEEKLDFINTDRLKTVSTEVMDKSHIFGNYFLTLIMKVLFRTPFNDSQSGMWIFKRDIWEKLNVESSGMPFSQEIKIEAYCKGFNCSEVPIQYRARTGVAKLSTIKDGIRNTSHLFIKRAKTIFETVPAHVINREVEVPLSE